MNAIASSNVDQLPQEVEFQGGTLVGANDESTNITNRANFYVGKGYTGVFKAAFRGVYTGTLTGEGTFNVYTGGVRCYFDGDWSEFAGTINAFKENRQNKKSYDPSWAFRNTKGLPNATLNAQKDVYVSNEGKDIEVGMLSGNGTFVGSGKWTVGGNNADFFLTPEIGVTSQRTNPYGGTINVSPSALKKIGTGKMSILTLGKVNAAATIAEGTVSFNDSKLATFVFGTNTTTIGSKGRIVGQGKLQRVTIESGGELMPCGSYVNETTPGTIKTTGPLESKDGSTLSFLFNATKQSQLQSDILTVNGTVKVILLNDYTPKAGDAFTLWTTTLFKGTPKFDLPALPAGLYWDTSGVAAKTGVLRVTDDAAAGIGQLGQDVVVSCEVYTVGGMLIGSFEAPRQQIRSEVKRLGVGKGVYVVKMRGGRNLNTETVVIR